MCKDTWCLLDLVYRYRFSLCSHTPVVHHLRVLGFNTLWYIFTRRDQIPRLLMIPLGKHSCMAEDGGLIRHGIANLTC